MESNEKKNYSFEYKKIHLEGINGLFTMKPKHKEKDNYKTIKKSQKHREEVHDRDCMSVRLKKRKEGEFPKNNEPLKLTLTFPNNPNVLLMTLI